MWVLLDTWSDSQFGVGKSTTAGYAVRQIGCYSAWYVLCLLCVWNQSLRPDTGIYWQPVDFEYLLTWKLRGYFCYKKKVGPVFRKTLYLHQSKLSSVIKRSATISHWSQPTNSQVNTYDNHFSILNSFTRIQPIKNFIPSLEAREDSRLQRLCLQYGLQLSMWAHSRRKW